MSESCIVKPTINVENEEKESELFNKLTSFTGSREAAIPIWSMFQIPEVIEGIEGLEKDSNGEVTFESINRVLNIKKLMQGNLPIDSLKEEAKVIDEDGNPIIYYSVKDAIINTNRFNKENPNAVATIYRNEGGYSINVEEKTLENSDEGKRVEFNYELNNRLLGILRSLGFDVSFTDDPKYNGVFNPLLGKESADGLRTIIQIAKGERGEEAFPEEFSHAMIAGLINHPLVKRLLNTLDEEKVRDILGNSFEDYSREYEGDFSRLRLEAAGKLLSQYIKKEKITPQDSFLQRIWNYLKSLFKGVNEDTITNAINEADRIAGQLAEMVTKDSISTLIDKTSLIKTQALYDINSRTSSMKSIADHAIEVMSKRIKITSIREKNEDVNHKDIKALEEMRKALEKKKYAKSCLIFLSDSLEQIEKRANNLNKLRTNDKREDSDLGKIRALSKNLREIKDFSDAYKDVIKNMMSLPYLRSVGEVEIEEEDAEEIAELATKTYRIINNINTDYSKLRMDTVYNFLKIYWGKENKEITSGPNKGKMVTLRMLLEMAAKDINFLDRLISSMSDASDPILSLITKAVTVQQYKRDEFLNNKLNEIRAAHKKLTDAGYTSDFMLERDEDGNLTGRIISDYDFEKFNREREAYSNELSENTLLTAGDRRVRLEKWEKEHTEEIILKRGEDREHNITERLPIYKKEVLSNLSPAQMEYYTFMIKLKRELDLKIPKRYTSLYNAVQIRNDATQAIIDNIKDPKRAAQVVLDTVKDKFVRRSDDEEFGEIDSEESLEATTKKVLLDFSNEHVIERLPIYYTKKLEDPNRLSTDFTAAISAYAGMSVNYDEMSKIIDALELTRDLVKSREVQQWSGDSKMEEAFEVAKSKFTNKYTKKGRNSNTGARIDDYYASVLYGESKLDEGTFKIPGTEKELDTAKTLDALKEYTGILGLGVNLFSGLSNILIGKIQMFIESIGGEYFTYADMAKGKKDYYANITQCVGELNASQKKNKLSLLIEKYDALSEFYENLRHNGYYKGPLSRIMGNSSIFFLNNMGEHYLHSRTMLAMLEHYKVKLNGKEISLYEAYEVKEKDGVYSVGLKEGVTKLDGKAFTKEELEKEFLDLKLKIKKVNQSMNGALNEEDKGAIHRWALGRLIMQFRQWMPAHYYRRVAKSYYDAQLGQWREGYYRTAWRFIMNILADLPRMKFQLATNWELLSEHEKANLKRAMAELSTFAAIGSSIAFMGPEKDRKGYWFDRMLIYNLKRIKMEVGASIPFFPVEFLKNILTMLQSPAAAIKSINQLGNIFCFWNMGNEITSGRYKGWTEYERDLINLIPIYPQVRKVTDITEEDYMFTMFNY